MFDVIAAILAWFYSVWPSYGMAIVFLTMAAMVVVTPFTMKGSRSMLKMQLLAPELKKIQNQHRGNRQAMNEASMLFYREHGVNPVGGCLPLIAQAPIFLVLYQVVHGLTRRTTEIGTQLGYTTSQYSTVETGTITPYGTTPILRNELPFDPDFLSRDTDLYQALSQETEMISWGVDLSRSASTAMSESIVAALPYFLMMALVLVTGLYQHRQIQGRNTGATMQPAQQRIMKLIPYFLPVVSYGIPAAVVVYFIISALFRIGQQAWITRSLYSGDESPGAELARQRQSLKEKGSASGQSGKQAKARSPRSVSPSKGRPTPKRDSRAPQRSAHRSRAQAKKPTSASQRRTFRSSRSGRSGRSAGSSRRVSGSGRSGKAPSRKRNRGGGRVTPPGSTARRPAPNRSKSKRKRR